MCKHCSNCITESDGEYGEYKYTYCSEEQSSQNLKGFPFKKPPKKCIEKKIFSLNPESYPNYWHGWGVMGMVCDSICQFALSSDKDCDMWTCEAFRYVEGRTDIYLHGKKDYEIDYREMLKGKKLTYRDAKGRKHLFRVKITEKCTNCNGEGIIESWRNSCPVCNYRGVVEKGIALP